MKKKDLLYKLENYISFYNFKKKKTFSFLKAIIYLKLKAMAATSSPPVGPVLGHCGIPAGPFCKDFNDRSKIFNTNTVLFVKLALFIDNTYFYDIYFPNLSFFFYKSVLLENGLKNSGYIYSNVQEKKKSYLLKHKYITQYQLFELVIYKLNNNQNNIILFNNDFLKSYIKSSISVLKSTNINLLIDNF